MRKWLSQTERSGVDIESKPGATNSFFFDSSSTPFTAVAKPISLMKSTVVTAEAAWAFIQAMRGPPKQMGESSKV